MLAIFFLMNSMFASYKFNSYPPVEYKMLERKNLSIFYSQFKTLINFMCSKTFYTLWLTDWNIPSSTQQHEIERIWTQMSEIHIFLSSIYKRRKMIISYNSYTQICSWTLQNFTCFFYVNPSAWFYHPVACASSLFDVWESAYQNMKLSVNTAFAFIPLWHCYWSLSWAFRKYFTCRF